MQNKDKKQQVPAPQLQQPAGVEKKKKKEAPKANANVIAAKPAGTEKKVDDIDAIFGVVKKGKSAAQPEAGDEIDAELSSELNEISERIKKARETKTNEPKAAPPKVVGSKDDIFGESVGKARKKTEEGFAIYSEEELGLSKKGGGDTPLCPFDCDCCY